MYKRQALSCNYCAFMSEDIRAALNSVDKGQYEAGLSIGLRPFTVIRKIVLPQAARIAVPGLSNNFINLFKSTAIGDVYKRQDNYQGNAVVNYTEREVPYTRIIEHKHFEFGTQEKLSLIHIFCISKYNPFFGANFV